MLKNVFTWILVVAVALTLAFKVVTRPKHIAPPPIVAVEVAPAPTPKIVVSKPPAAPVKPAPKPEQAKAIIKVHRAHERTKAKHVTVTPDSGAPGVGVSCEKLKGYVDKFGRDRVKIGATAYGYTENDAEKALKGCGL